MTNISVKKHNRKSRKNNRRKGGSSCEGVGLETKSGWFSKYCAPEEEAVKDLETKEEKKEENTIFPPLFTSNNDKEAPVVEGLTTPAEAAPAGEQETPAVEGLTTPAGEQEAPAGEQETPAVEGLTTPAGEVEPEKTTTGGKNKKSKKQSKRKTAKKGGNKKQNKSKKNSRKNRSKK